MGNQKKTFFSLHATHTSICRNCLYNLKIYKNRIHCYLYTHTFMHKYIYTHTWNQLLFVHKHACTYT